MNILSSLKETEQQLKMDVDKGNFPEWYRLMHVLRFISLYGQTEIFESSGGGYHLIAKGVPSTMKQRRALRDCAGRLYVSDRRFEMIGSFGDIIFWTGKAKLKYKKVKDKIVISWTRKRVPDRRITLRDVLALPFWSQIDTHHRISRVKWLKRRKGLEKEAKRKNVKLAYAFR